MEVIEKTLEHLQNLYIKDEANSEILYFVAKLAVLEVGGWLQHQLETVIENCFEGNSPELRKEIQKRTEKNNGFLGRHIQELIEETLGMRCFEKIKGDMGPDWGEMVSYLSDLWKIRSEFAHTFQDSLGKGWEKNQKESQRKAFPLNAPRVILRNFSAQWPRYEKLLGLIKTYGELSSDSE